MKFCSTCDNLLTLSHSKETGGLYYTCRSCKKTEDCPENFDPCVFKKNYGGSEKVFYEMFINKYTKHDPTLPHVHTMPCQNVECAKKSKDSKEESDIIYMRYSEDKMKYVYLCCKCDSAWIHPEYQQTQFLEMD
tara:strand:+ start:462 stop:863 length:402 start_codon:yes stop_codon:yes gene_type:complete